MENSHMAIEAEIQPMKDSHVAIAAKVQQMEEVFSVKMDQILTAIQQITIRQSRSDDYEGNCAPHMAIEAGIQHMKDSHVAIAAKVQHMEEVFSVKMDQILTAIQQITIRQSRSDDYEGNCSPTVPTSNGILSTADKSLLDNLKPASFPLEIEDTCANHLQIEALPSHVYLKSSDFLIFEEENARLISREETYISDIDSEGHVEESLDDDMYYASGVIPKLQFRKDASKALWVDELGMAEVLQKKGRMWITTGIVRDGKIYCTIEETLYLAEIGALSVVNVDGTLISLCDLYGKLAEDKKRHGCSLESFQVYRHLKFLGYIVGRHGVPWTVKKSTTKINYQGVVEYVSAKEPVSEDNNFIIELFRNLQFDELRPMFDIYSPNSKFKKSVPGDPCFLLCLSSEHPPSKQEIEDLERLYCGPPIKFCTVEHGRVSFFSFTKVELPTLP